MILVFEQQPCKKKIPNLLNLLYLRRPSINALKSYIYKSFFFNLEKINSI